MIPCLRWTHLPALTLLGVFGLAPAHAQQALRPLTAEAANAVPLECTLVVDAASGEQLYRAGTCDQRFAPASSFKVPLAVIGFDAGILKDAHNPTWPYKPEYDAPKRVQKDVDPTIWEADSVLWYSREITRQLGQERFAGYVARLRYGNQDVSGDPGKDNGLTRSWLGSSLLISPEEQVGFLRRLLASTLPVSVEAQEKTRAILPEFTADGWTIHGKTGSTWLTERDGKYDRDRPLGWFVGWGDKDAKRIVFARLYVGTEPYEDGMGLKQRELFLKALPGLISKGAARGEEMNPIRPVPAVLAVALRGEEVLLVRRANPPDQGLWGFPGGRMEIGESHLDAALRELNEETGISADEPRLVTVLDFIEHDAAGTLAHHFAMIAVLCRWMSGEGEAADDALETRWFKRAELPGLRETASLKVEFLAEAAFAMSAVED